MNLLNLKSNFKCKFYYFRVHKSYNEEKHGGEEKQMYFTITNTIHQTLHLVFEQIFTENNFFLNYCFVFKLEFRIMFLLLKTYIPFIGVFELHFKFRLKFPQIKLQYSFGFIYWKILI